MSAIREHRVATPLFLLAALLQPTGLLVAMDELFAGGDFRVAALLVATLMTAQQGATFHARRRSVLLFTTIAFALWALGTALDLLVVEGDVIGLLLGGGTLVACAGLGRTRFAGVAPFWNLLGSVSFLAGLFSLTEDTLAEPLFLLAACAGVFLSTVQRSRVLLAVSTVANLWYLSWAGYRWFGDTLGWPMLLILFGLALVTIGGLALRIDARHLRGAPAPPR